MAFDPLAPFTGSAYTDAANKQRDYLGGQQNLGLSTIGANQQATLADLQAGQTGALKSIRGGIGTARGDISGSVPAAIGALTGGESGASTALTGAVDPAIAALSGGVGAATDAYNRLLANQGADSTTTNTALADALGLNGPEGTARAQASFTGGPGFQFGLGTGLDALTRAANAAGGGNLGGNVLRESQKFGQDYGTQAWQQYLTDLQTKLNQEGAAGGTAATGTANAALTGGTGAANIYTGTGSKLSDLIASTGAGKAGIYTGAGKDLASLASTGGLAAGNVYTDTAARQAAANQAATGSTLDLIKGLSTPYASTYNTEAAAQTQGPANLFNLVGNVATFGAGGGFNPASYGQLFGAAKKVA